MGKLFFIHTCTAVDLLLSTQYQNPIKLLTFLPHIDDFVSHVISCDSLKDLNVFVMHVCIKNSFIYNMGKAILYTYMHSCLQSIYYVICTKISRIGINSYLTPMICLLCDFT